MKPFIFRITLYLLLIFSLNLFSQTPISNESELLNINLDGNYILTNDIQLSEEWKAIGSEKKPFTGIFDGNGFTISNLLINKSSSDNQALFGYTNDAQIKNLGINEASIKANNNIGAIVGCAERSIIQQCFVTNSDIEGNKNIGSIVGKIKSNTIVKNVYATESVEIQSNSEAGGIIGLLLSGELSKSYFAGTISASNTRANGIVGLVGEDENNTIKSVNSNVNLSEYLLVNSDNSYPNRDLNGKIHHARILDKGNQDVQLNKNYSLLETKLGKTKIDANTLQEREAIIMSFNTPYFSDSESNEFKRWNYRKAAIISAINDVNPIILGMQEIRKNPQLNDLDAALSDRYARFGVGRDDGKEAGDYSVIYYRKDVFELLKTGDFWMSETPDVPSFGWGAAHRRVTSWGHLKIKGTDKELIAYNTHFAFDSQKAIEESVRLMRDSIEGRLKGNLNTVITTGDYNAPTTNIAFKYFVDFVQSTRDEAPITDKRGTFNSWTYNSFGDVIDHVFYKNCIPKSFKVHTDTYNGIQLMSDHHPIVAGLNIPLDIEYGEDREHGESIINKNITKTKAFYSHTLDWDFAEIWTIDEGNSYPTLKVFNEKQSSYDIFNENDLKNISNDLNGIYNLKSDINLSGDWIPIGSNSSPFTGILNGNGKIIRGLKFNQQSIRQVALFSVTKDAIIRNIGIEGASLRADADVAALVGLMSGGLIEKSYVVNSYIEGRDHVASFVGKITGGAILQNCYSNAEIVSRATQAGGLCGVILDTGTKIYKSYFSGKVSTPIGSQRPAGIVALVDNNGRVVIERSVNLASSIIGENNVRIAHFGNNTITAIFDSNYSISSSIMNDKGGIISINDVNYGSNNMQGQNFNDDVESLSEDFYVETLGWDFENIWKFSNHGGYPMLNWQSSMNDIHIFELKNPTAAISSTVDLNKAVLSNNAANVFVFRSEKKGVTINEFNQLTIDNPSNFKDNQLTVDIDVKEGFKLTENSPTSLTINLIPDIFYINEISDFNLIETYPQANFKLTKNIDFKNANFSGICDENKPFAGIFDGDGFVISNCNISSSGKRGVGFFNVTQNAVIKNLGIENINVQMTTRDNKKSTGGLIGLMRGGILENSYVSDSYVEGYDHVGSVVGSIEGTEEKLGEGTLIRNCFGADNEVYTRVYQAGGFSGTVMYGTVENCYFSGIVRSGRDRAVGLFGYLDNSGHDKEDVFIQSNLNLASEIRSVNFEKNKLFRIIDNNGMAARPMTLRNNYSISTSLLKGSDGSGEATIEITATGRNGSNVTEAFTKRLSFYANGLKWDMENVWIINEGISYPTLRVFQKNNTSVSITNDNELKYKVTIINNILSIETKNIDPTEMLLYTVDGQQIFNSKLYKDIQYSLPNKGVFLVKLKSNEDIQKIKIIN